MTEASSPADGNPYRPSVPVQPQPDAQSYAPPYTAPHGQQPYVQGYTQPYTQPHGQQPSGPASYAPPRRTNGTAVASLVTGTAAAVLAFVSFVLAVAPVTGVLHIGLGIVAIGLGLVAIVLGVAGIRRSGPAGGKGAAIGGSVTGGVALVLGALSMIAGVTALDATSQDSDQAVEQDPTADKGDAADAKEPRDPVEASPLDGIAAPAGSTANGGIPVGASGVAGTSDGAAGDVVVVSVYSDYMCPYCGEFEAVNGATLRELRVQGDIVIEYHPVSILDRLSLGSAYSTRAATAAALVADRAPEAFVGFDAALFAQQPAEGTVGWTDAEIAGIARGAGVPEDVAVVIESGEYLTGADSFVPWVAAATEQGAQDLGRLATPTVLLDGAPLTVDWGIPGALAQAIERARG